MTLGRAPNRPARAPQEAAAQAEFGTVTHASARIAIPLTNHFSGSRCQVIMKRFEPEEPALSQDGIPSPQLPGLGRVFTDGKDGRVERLIERAIRGDVIAFEALVEPHLAHLYRLAAAMVGPDEARDVTQDTLVSAWRQIRTLKRRDRLEAWLRSILMNRARNLLRTRSRHSVVRFEPVSEHGVGLFEEPIAGLHGRWAVEDALGILRPDERAVIVLHYFADLTLRQVAESLGIREGTVKSRLHAGLKSLRHHYAEEPA